MLKDIIIVCDFAYIEGGASRVAHESAIGLADIGYNVTLFSAVGPISCELKKSKVNVVCLNQSDILHNKNRVNAVIQGIYNKYAEQQFRTLLKEHDKTKTIIHIHTYTKGLSSAVFKVANEENYKTVVTIHDYFLICPNGGLYNYKTHRICELKPMSAACICSNCDSRTYAHKLFRVMRQKEQNKNVWGFKNLNFIFISEFEKRQFLKRKNVSSHTYFLENPINFVNRYKVDCSRNNVYLYTGRLTDDKGIRIFCEGVTKTGVKGIVVGKGPLLDELQDKYPNITFTGWVDKKDMKQYLDQTRCFVFPSTYYEASPLTPLEIMACGIPCVISDKNTSSELIQNGINGFLYDGYSSDELAKVINETKFNNNLISAMSDNIYYNFDAEKYSLKNHLNHLKTIYIDIMNK
ncbi:MAG: glycosyltransferase family 4 protein [Stecheria intestinalis]|nr:glycosyltransferase family 4 protein [Stecheria intestinalis]